jgi:hypothetical protein
MRLNISPKRGLNTDLAAILSSDSVPWCKKKHLLHLNFCLFSIFLLFSSNGYDGSMMNGLLALVQWNQFMQQPYGAWLGFINAIQYLGAIVCFPFVVWSNDRFGRKPSIAIGYFWLLLGVSLQSAAQNPTMFVMGRLFIGVASTLFGISATCLVTETAFPTHRGVFTALSNCGWWVNPKSPTGRSRTLPISKEEKLTLAKTGILDLPLQHGLRTEVELLKMIGLGESHLYSRLLAPP